MTGRRNGYTSLDETRTDWEKGQKAFSSSKGQKKTTGKNRGIYEWVKAASWQSLGEPGRGLRENLMWWEGGRGWVLLGKSILLGASAWGSVWPQIAVLEGNLLPSSTLNTVGKLLLQCLIIQNKCSIFFSKQMLSGLRQFKFTWKFSKAGTCNENCCLIRWISTSYTCPFFFPILGLF